LEKDRSLSKRPNQGFILLEAMLACAVLAGAALVVFQSYRSSLRTLEADRQLYRAALLLEERAGMREKGGNDDPEPLEDPILGPITWQEDSLQAGDPTWHMERMTLGWGEGSHAQNLELSTPIQD
jgi:type II secretory pathway pseudopilin PulG